MTLKQMLVLSVLVLCGASAATCQDNPTDEIGVKPFGSYGTNNVDTIDYENGNVFIRIPLFSLPQLGKLSLSYSLILNNKGYTGQTLACDTAGDGGQECIQGAVRSSGTGYNLGPTVVADQTISTLTQEMIPAYTEGSMPLRYWWSVYSPTGAQTVLGWDSQNTSLARGLDGGGYTLTGTLGAYNAFDDYNPNCPAQGLYDYTLYTASGISYTSSAACDFSNLQIVMKDPNSNSLTFYPSYQYTQAGAPLPSGGVVDSVGRQIPNVPAPTSAAAANCPNLNVTGQQAQVASLWQVPGPNGGTSSYLICYTTVGYSTNFFGRAWESLDGVSTYWVEANGAPGAIQSVVLPNGTYWGFVYDSTTNWQAPVYAGDPLPAIAYGDLVRLILPSGGSISYTYTNQSSCPTSLPNWAPDRFVQSRTVNDANGNSALWQYNFSGPYGGETTTETDPDLNDTQHIFTALLGSQCSLAETTTKVYAGSSTKANNLPLRTTTRHFNSAVNYVTGTVVNTVPSSETTTLDDGETEETTYSYPTLMSSQAIETCYSATYCYGTFGSAILFNRPQSVTKTGYGLSSSSVAISNYMWLDSTSGYFAKNWLTALSSICTPNPGYTSCTPSSADTASYTSYGYDGNGNVNSVSKWLSGPTPQTITSTSTYTSVGELFSTTDPLNYITQYTYDPSGPGLFPSKVQKPTTTNGISHIDYFTYDLNTGNMLTHVDQNASSSTDAAHTTTYSYDKMGRLVDVLYPTVPVGSSAVTANPETKFCYTDLGGSICPQVTAPPYQLYTVTSASPDPSVMTMKKYDGLGRPIQSVLISDPEGPQITDSTYDLLGRVSTSSNAYRTKDDPTYDLVTYVYDALGRKTKVSHSGDNSFTSWSYTGPATTFTDELLHQTTSTSDALGRLVGVVDPAALNTSYTYNVLGNLIGVNQAGGAGDAARVRSFTYDSFSRLVCSSNPESSAASTTCPASASAGYTPGTLGYSYDLNGNVHTKTDANGVVQTNSYDALNRLLSVVYSSDTASSPSSCFLYDGAASSNMIGRLVQEWTSSYGSGCPSSRPASVISAKAVLAYDAMGRALSTQQCVLTMCANTATPFQLAQSYDLAGSQTAVTQGLISGVVPYLRLSNNYDGAGRLSSLQSSWNGLPNSNDPLVLFSAKSYSPVGIQNWQLGNYLNIQQTYDTRNRPTSEVVTRP